MEICRRVQVSLPLRPDAVEVVPSVYQPSGEPAKFSGHVVTRPSLNSSQTLSALLVILTTSPSQDFSGVLISLSTLTKTAGVWSASLSGFITAPRSISYGYEETLPTRSHWFDRLVIRTYLMRDCRCGQRGRQRLEAVVGGGSPCSLGRRAWFTEGRLSRRRPRPPERRRDGGFASISAIRT